MTTPFSHLENESNALLKTNHSKNCITFRVKVILYKHCTYESRLFLVVKPCAHQVVAVAGGARGNKQLKGPNQLNVNSNSLTLQHSKLICWDRTSLYKTEISCNDLVCNNILSSKLTVLANTHLKQINLHKNVL